MSGGAPAVDRGSVLVRCRGAAEKHLGEQLAGLLERLANHLGELGQHSRDREEREQYLKAAHRLHHEREPFLPAFRKEFEERFEERARWLSGMGSLQRDLDRSELQALKTNVLENEAAIGRLSARLKEHTGAALGELSARFATLFRCAAVNDGDNPLGPLTIARGVFAGFAAIKIEGRALRAVRDELEKRLAQPVLELYRGLNKALDGLGVAPAVRRADAGAAAAAPPAPRSTAEAASAPSGNRSGGSPSAAAEAAAARAVEAALAGAALPPVLEIFVRQSWHRVLAQAYGLEGEAGTEWREAAATLRDLVWSLRMKLEPGERSRLVALLPPLLKKINAGMDAVALDAEGRKAVLDALMAHHRVLLHPQRAAAGRG